MSSRPASAPSSAESARRRRTNLTLDAALLTRARDLGINVSQASERGLAEEIKRVERERWLEENRDAIESSNAWVEANGLPLEKYRLF